MALLTLCWYALKAHSQDVRAWLFALLSPLVILLLVGYGIAPRLEGGALVEPFAVAVVDEDDTPETRALIQHLANSPSLREMVTVEVTGYQAALRLLERDEVAAVVIIPEGFVWNMERGRNLPFTVIGNPRRPLQSAMMKQLMQGGADLVTAAQSGVNTVLHYLVEAGLSSREMERWFSLAVTEFTLQALGRTELLEVRTVSATGRASVAQYYAVSLGYVLTLLTGMAFLWRVRDQERGLLLRMRSMGVPIRTAVTARFLATWLIQLLQMAVIAGMAALVLPWRLQGSGWLLVLVILTAAAVNASLMLLVAALAPDSAAANVAALALILTLSLVGGSILPPAYLPPSVALLGWLTPNRWAVDGILAAVFGGSGKVALHSAAVLGAAAAACVGLAATALGRIAR